MSTKLPTGRPVTLLAVAAICVVASAAWLPVRPTSAASRVFRLAASPATAAGAALPQAAGHAATSGSGQGVDSTAAPGGVQGSVADARRFSTAFATVAAAVTPTVVRIQTERTLGDLHGKLPDRFRDMFDRLPDDHPDPQLYPQVAGGTGVLVSSDGLILTNNHVIAGADRIAVTLADKRVFNATVVGTDPTTDIALIVIDQGGLPVARLGDSERIRVGE